MAVVDRPPRHQLVAPADRIRRRSQVAAESAALEAIDADRTETTAITGVMAVVRAPE